ncbi:MAG TPA: hypothetical protein VGR35_20520 [Tepidisphaeraceae bacterium]|nr:hypothetical protein [Tepidisphaeraceae bacterium]
MHAAVRTAILALPVLLTGCMPGMHTSRPQFRGTVIATGTREPVPGASVTVEPDSRGNPARTVVTNSRGDFVIPRRKKFAIVFLMQYPYANWDYVIRADAPGFFETSTEVSRVGPMPPKRVEKLQLELSG